MSDSNKPTDELESYLKGRDGVSAAYQSLSREVPPEALDQHIIQLAHESVNSSPEQTRIDRTSETKSTLHFRRYSIAASICLSVIIVSLFLNNEEQIIQQNFDESFSQIEILIAPDPVSSADVSTSPALTLSPVAGARAFNSNLVEKIESNESNESVVNTQSFELDDFNSIEDIPYQNSAETWLLEIQRLLNSGSSTVARERELFSAAYPDQDIDEALTALREL